MIKKSRENNRQPSICVCVNVRSASRAITKFYDKVMEPCGLKVTQFSILWNIRESGPLSVTELAHVLRLDRTTLVRNLKSLERSKFIESSAGNDPRKRLILINNKGIEMLITATPYWEKAQMEIKAVLGSEKLAGLNSLLLEIDSLAV